MTRSLALGIALAAALATGCASLWAGGPNDPAADRHFVEEAAREWQAEVKLGELAVDRAEDPRVKELARTILDDFKASEDPLRQLAAAKGIALPAQLDGQRDWDYRALARLHQYAFHRYYVNMMADYHVRDVRRFRHEVKHAADPELRRFAAANLKMLKDHREKAQVLMPQFGLSRTEGGDVPQ
jgi:putative membrane protein